MSINYKNVELWLTIHCRWFFSKQNKIGELIVIIKAQIFWRFWDTIHFCTKHKITLWINNLKYKIFMYFLVLVFHRYSLWEILKNTFGSFCLWALMIAVDASVAMCQLPIRQIYSHWKSLIALFVLDILGLDKHT